MPIIRYRYHYGNTYLKRGGLAERTSALIQDRVRFTYDEGVHILPFRGFTKASRDHSNLPHVALDGVTAITYDPMAMSGWIELPKRPHLAVIYKSCVYLVLDDKGLPVAY
ncbi:hypothetical protein EXT48_08365 [Pseudoalteromonas sp. CO348]|uniref:hypothetical protein n=1 Tax=Pseudoalteromonas sp. CO348 TaxID=1777271 RepID=UPI001022A82A|nr:hypothetical protein [Pseudoalteromonas sp. CO348]RZG05538.1 hypothetical protein EXT48_08365 [Pseudoalteromonas sp. CO348]